MLKILLVDDEESICKGMRIKMSMALHDKAYEYRYALNGAAGIELCGEWLPDIAILDINLPDMSGVDVMPRVRQVSPDTLFFALSAYDNYNYVRNMLVNGAVDYLLKPVSASDLREALLKTIAALEAKRRAVCHDAMAKLSVLALDAESMSAEAFAEAFSQNPDFSDIYSLLAVFAPYA